MTAKFSRRLLSLSLGLLAGIALTPVASAASFEKTLGVAGGYASYNDGGYADVYFHCNIARHVRIAPEIGYVFRNDHKSAFECAVDVQFPFRVAKAFNLYPLTGICVNNWQYRHGDRSTHGGFDFGGGMELYLTSELKLSVQAKYSLMNDTSGAFIGMGLGYVF